MHSERQSKVHEVQTQAARASNGSEAVHMGGLLLVRMQVAGDDL